MKDVRARVVEKYMMKLLRAPKVELDGVWCCIFFVLFLVKPSSNTTITSEDNNLQLTLIRINF